MLKHVCWRRDGVDVHQTDIHLMAEKLIKDQGIDSAEILECLSDNKITLICDEIRRPGGLFSRMVLTKGNQISVLVAKNLNLALFTFKSMKHLFKP